MALDDFGRLFLAQSISWVPLVIVWAFGLSKVRRLTGKYAGIGRKASIAFGGFITVIVINNVLFAYLLSTQDTARVGMIMGGLNVLSTVLHVIFWIFIISAIVDERDKGAKLPEDDPFAN